MDISSLLNDAIQTLGVIVLAVAIAAARKLFALMQIKITADQAKVLDTVANNALAWGIAQVTSLINEKGWNHPEVKSRVIQAALGYAQANAKEGLQRAGIDITDRVKSSTALAPIIERAFSNAMSNAATSPATPPTDTKPVA